MASRSFTRVLGDTNLERKCRVLFGVSLFLLIVGAFWYAERETRQLIFDNTKEIAQFYVAESIVTGHFATLAYNQDKDLDGFEGSKAISKNLYQGLRDKGLRIEFLKLDRENSVNLGKDTWQGDRCRLAQGQERDLINRLLQQQRQEWQRLRESPVVEVPSNIPPDPFPQMPEEDLEAVPVQEDEQQSAQESGEGLEPDPIQQVRQAIPPVGDLKPQPDLGEYHYYQPVYWPEDCFGCHTKRAGSEGPEQWPIRVAKVVMPGKRTTEAMNRVYARLLTTAIVTVFLAMIALYLVVRYVIVKPLKHLRDISEEIRRGNTRLRADLQTNDEFQELGESFNRMLRHLVDTEVELRKANQELDGKVDQLAQANMQLFEMNRLKSDFLSSMSHELRTPLNSIIGFADVLKDLKDLPEKQRRYATNIGRSGRLLLEMINDILDLAKMESGKMECRPSEFSVEALIQANCDMLRSLSEEKNIDLEVNVQPDLPPVYQDQGKFQQILTNLLSNAIKFTPEGGRITVSARRNVEGRLELIVADTGIGISEEDRQVVFEKFRQGSAVLGTDHLTREYSGTGLGLSIVKELCRLLDGKISFTSEVGKGSEFVVVLPYHWDRPVRHEPDLGNRLEAITRSGRMDAVRPLPDSTGGLPQDAEKGSEYNRP